MATLSQANSDNDKNGEADLAARASTIGALVLVFMVLTHGNWVQAENIFGDASSPLLQIGQPWAPARSGRGRLLT